MSELVRRGAGSALSKHSDSSRSTAQERFDSSVVEYDELPDELRPHDDSPTAASEVDNSDQKVRRKPGTDLYWQTWKAWRASRDAITVMTVRRMLDRKDDKRFKPNGRFEVESSETFPVASPPSRRQGTVPDAPATEVRQQDPDEPDDEGERMLAYLPPVVQREVRATVPDPTYSHGTLSQWTSLDGLPSKQGLSLIRFTPAVAVVVTAEKEADSFPRGTTPEQAQTIVASKPWKVTRYTYRLGAPSAAVTGPDAAGELT